MDRQVSNYWTRKTDMLLEIESTLMGKISITADLWWGKKVFFIYDRAVKYYLIGYNFLEKANFSKKQCIQKGDPIDFPDSFQNF